MNWFDYFMRKLADFMFKQRPEFTVVFLACFALGGVVTKLWLKIGDMEYQHRADRIEIRKECAASIADLRLDLKDCQHRNDTLTRENTVLHSRVSALEARTKH